MKMAQSAGMQVISGVEMFVQQGAHQFEIWTGKPAPVAEMQYVVNRELQTRAAVENATAQTAAASCGEEDSERKRSRRQELQDPTWPSRVGLSFLAWK